MATRLIPKPAAIALVVMCEPIQGTRYIDDGGCAQRRTDFGNT